MVLTIIAEYNPFHNGHLLHLEKSKEISGCKYTAVIMGGNFVQRGEPAIFDKFIRTRAALLNGADIVIELPVYYSCASAEYFATGAVQLIKYANISNTISFGTEAGSVDGISAIADFLLQNGEAVSREVKTHLFTGSSYPHARKQAVIALAGKDIDPGLLDTPNNILAVEYLKAIKALGLQIRIITVKRNISHHSQAIGPLASATAIRKAIIYGDYDKACAAVPENTWLLIKTALNNGDGPYIFNNLSQILHYILKTHSASYIEQIFEIAEGLENRIINSSNKYFFISDIITDIKTKRYTFTKINRIILHIILDILKNDYKTYEAFGGPQYIRVLGFREDAGGLLNLLSKKARLPLVVNLKKDIKKLSPIAAAMLEKEIQASDIFRLANSGSTGANFEKGAEYRMPVVIV